MKMAVKAKTTSFCHNSQTCTGSYPHANPLGTPKLWAISHENGHNTRKPKVFVHALKHVSGLKVILNRPGTTKLL